ncbi:hypothetical protein QE152_g19238 [Popillia japonica]|uniref:Uncharacterized protein n=1 Tax=Popillia japonica TaxID=7064 RepID=A0AAW1KPL4_POPJA
MHGESENGRLRKWNSLVLVLTLRKQTTAPCNSVEKMQLDGTLERPSYLLYENKQPLPVTRWRRCNSTEPWSARPRALKFECQYGKRTMAKERVDSRFMFAFRLESAQIRMSIWEKNGGKRTSGFTVYVCISFGKTFRLLGHEVGWSMDCEEIKL